MSELKLEQSSMQSKLDQVLKALQPPAVSGGASPAGKVSVHGSQVSQPTTFKEMVQELAPVLAQAMSASKSSTWGSEEEESKRVGRMVKRIAKFDGKPER
jgi:hypothetical protein